MGLFSKKKAANKDKGKAPVADSTEEQKPREKQMYIPRYAARDGLIGAPSGASSQDEAEAFQRAYKVRMSREMNASTWSLPDPRMSSPRMSRNSSSMSLDWTNNGGASRMSNPFATPMGGSRPGSFQNLAILSNNPPVPAIPQQYASSSRPTSQRGSSLYSQAQTSTSSSQFTVRPRVSQRQSYMATSPLARTPENYEHTPIDTPDLSTAEHSSAASTTSSCSGEVMEIPMKADSPAQYMLDRTYPDDPRKFNSGASTPRSYFAHAAKPEIPAAPVVAVAPPKKKRFSFGRKSSAVAAH